MSFKLVNSWRSVAGNRLAAVVVVLVLAAVGGAIVATKAATFAASQEAESGTRSGNQAAGDPSGASGGASVKFGTSGGTGSCPVATLHAPDGPDGMGGCWPGPLTTGVPAGTVLSAYTGPMKITTDNTVIDSKTINGTLDIEAKNVTIKNSKLTTGAVSVNGDTMPSNTAWSVIVMDSEIDSGGPIDWNNNEAPCIATQPTCAGRSTVTSANMTVLRSNLHGGQTEVQCDMDQHGTLCDIENSWLHGQLDGMRSDNVPFHMGGMLSDGLNPAGSIKFIHNRAACDWPVNPLQEGCTGDFNMIPNFAPIHNVTVDSNYFVASNDLAYCTYGGDKNGNVGTYVVYRNNVFGKHDSRISGTTDVCGDFGPVAAFNGVSIGNVWTNNKYDDGTPILCANATDCE